MKTIIIEKGIEQIQKYHLENNFASQSELIKWLTTLKKKEISNFLNLDVNPEEIKFPKELLINKNLLNCLDYQEKIKEMMEIKNGDGCWHLFDRLCSPNFLNSKNYSQDMELLKEAKTPRYALWVIADKTFIHSPSHFADLKKIISAGDDLALAGSLAEISKNKLSLQSEYHQKDMDLIMKYGSSCVQEFHSYPEHSLNNLAVNVVSLKDKYHLENMQILAENYSKSYYLYRLMTDREIIQGKNYRKEIEILSKASSPLKARAMFYYIKNPDRKAERNSLSNSLYNELYTSGIDFSKIYLLDKKLETIKGMYHPRYLQYLALLNTIEDKYVIYVEELLSNLSLNQSGYLSKDIETILTIKDDDIFFDLYEVMCSSTSTSSKYHLFDVDRIAQEKDDQKRKWLFLLATNEENLQGKTHLDDIILTSLIDFSILDGKKKEMMEYLFFQPKGITDPSHFSKLENLIEDQSFQIASVDTLEIKKGNLLKKIKL